MIDEDTVYVDGTDEIFTQKLTGFLIDGICEYELLWTQDKKACTTDISNKMRLELHRFDKKVRSVTITISPCKSVHTGENYIILDSSPRTSDTTITKTSYYLGTKTVVLDPLITIDLCAHQLGIGKWSYIIRDDARGRLLQDGTINLEQKLKMRPIVTDIEIVMEFKYDNKWYQIGDKKKIVRNTFPLR